MRRVPHIPGMRVLYTKPSGRTTRRVPPLYMEFKGGYKVLFQVPRINKWPASISCPVAGSATVPHSLHRPTNVCCFFTSPSCCPRFFMILEEATRKFPCLSTGISFSSPIARNPKRPRYCRWQLSISAFVNPQFSHSTCMPTCCAAGIVCRTSSASAACHLLSYAWPKAGDWKKFCMSIKMMADLAGSTARRSVVVLWRVRRRGGREVVGASGSKPVSED